MDFYPLFYILSTSLSFFTSALVISISLFMPFSFQTLKNEQTQFEVSNAFSRDLRIYIMYFIVIFWIICVWRCHNGAAYLIPAFSFFLSFYECPFGKEGVLCLCSHRTIVSFLYFKGFYCILPPSIEGVYKR